MYALVLYVFVKIIWSLISVAVWLCMILCLKEKNCLFVLFIYFALYGMILSFERLMGFGFFVMRMILLNKDIIGIITTFYVSTSVSIIWCIKTKKLNTYVEGCDDSVVSLFGSFVLIPKNPEP